MHHVEYLTEAIKSLRKMPAHQAQIIRKKILRLAQDPYAKHNNASKLQGRDGYRLRVGDWRVFYTIEDDRLVVLVVDIKPRGSAYQ